MPRYSLSDMTHGEFAVIRDRLGLSLPEIAAELGVNARTVKRWANPDDAVPSEEHAASLRAMLASRQERLRSDVSEAKASRKRPVVLSRFDSVDSLHAHAPEFQTPRSWDAHLASLTAALDIAGIAWTINSEGHA